MTTINTYPVSIHTDNSIALNPNHRLCILHWKEPTAKAKLTNSALKKLPSLSVSIPAIKLSVTPAIIASAMQAAFEDMQKAAIQTEVERQIGVYTGQQLTMPTISEETFSLETIAATQIGGRKSKDMLTAWFDTNLSDNLFLAVASKRGYDVTNPDTKVPDEDAKSMTTAINQVKDLLSSLAAPTTKYAPHILEQLTKAVTLANDDSTKSWLLAKLTNLTAPREVSISINL